MSPAHGQRNCAITNGGKPMSLAHGQRNRAITHGGKPEERVGGSVLKPPYSKYSRGGCMSAYAINNTGQSITARRVNTHSK